MPVPDIIINVACYGLTVLTGGISIGCLIARDRMARQRDEARTEAARWEARWNGAQDELLVRLYKITSAEQDLKYLRRHARSVAEDFRLYRAAEPTRAAAAIKAHQSRIGKAGRAKQLAAVHENSVGHAAPASGKETHDHVSR